VHDVEYNESALKALNELPKATKERILWKILEAKEDPYRYFLRLKGSHLFRLRVGDYRVIAEIDEKTLRIRTVGHRKNIYEYGRRIFSVVPLFGTLS
jgi:mRNA interferase RelE/StbE